MFGVISFINKQQFASKFLFTIALFLLITLTRFCTNLISIEQPVNDARYFKGYVEYFRGEVPSSAIRPASNWRILVPYIAAQLPLKPIIAINLVNIFCLALSLFFLYSSMKTLNINDGFRWIGCWIFIFSFPTFYYSAIGYIDPGVTLFVSAGIYYSITSKFWGVLIAILLGSLTKETIVVILPFVFLHGWFSHGKQILSWTILYLLAFGAINFLLRKYAYVSPGENNPHFWGFSFNAFLLNTQRLNSYLAPVLSFGLPGLIFAWLSYKRGWTQLKKDPLFLSTWFLLIGALSLFAISAIATFCDGRIIWLAYYPLIIASMKHLNETYNV